MKYSSKLLFAVASLLALNLYGSAYVVYKTDVSVAWPSGFRAALDNAKATGRPLVMIWSNYGCDWCNHLKTAINESAAFSAWKNSSGYDFLCVEGKKTIETLEAFNFAINAGGAQPGLTAFPFVVLVQYAGERMFALNFVGRLPGYETLSNSKESINQSKSQLVQMLMDNADGFFRSVAATLHPAFAVGETECDRLEACPETKEITVPLRREYNLDTVETNYLNGAEIVWSAGETEKFAVVDGKTRLLELRGANGELIDTRTVTEVEPRNTPKNPCWIGERTADSLAAGEWTMDMETASARAQAHGRPVLTIVGGSVWCPDCVKVDHYLVDTVQFRDWLVSNDVSCVAIDVPPIHKASATTCLLTYEPMTVSDRYVNCTEPKQARVQSGAGYLSRHGVPHDGAVATYARNLNLITNDVMHGGLCRPEQMGADNERTGPFKTGIPCLIMSRPDGTISGRLYQFNNVSPGDTSATSAYLCRMDELVALFAEPDEEANTSWMTTPNSIGLEDSANATISSIDLNDVYRLDGIEHWATGRVSIASAAAGDKDEKNVRLKVIKVVDGQVVSTQKAEGGIFAGTDIFFTCDDANAQWYVEVEAIDTSKTFLLEREGMSTTPYTLTTAVGYPESRFEFGAASVGVGERTAGTLSIPVKRLNGASGDVAIDIEVVAESTTADPDGYELQTAHLEWAEGDTQDKQVLLRIANDTIYEGNRTIALAIAGTDQTCSVNVTEDDKAVVGKLSIATTVPAMSKKGTVTVREGSVVDVGIERIDGAAKPFGATLSATAGTLSSNRVDWANNDKVPLKHVEFEVPMLADLGKATSCKISLAPDKGISAATKTLTVQVLAADCPEFLADNVAFACYRYVELSGCSMPITNTTPGSKVAVTRLSGALPAGVKAALTMSNGICRLEFTGVPTAAKACEATYQVKETVGRTVRKGLTARVAFNVTDISQAPPGGGSPLNPAIAASRTVKNAMVVAPGGRLAGLLTLTIPPTGKVSAKYACSEGTISFAGKSWTMFDPMSGDASVSLSSKGYGLALVARPDGSVAYELSDPAAEEPMAGDVEYTEWSAACPATAFKGYYTVDLPTNAVLYGVDGIVPTGDAWLTLKMDTARQCSSGTMSYSGCLPNGKTFSGSGVLVRKEDAYSNVFAILPVYYRTATDFFTAAIKISADAATLYAEADDHQTVSAADGVIPTLVHYAKETTNGCYAVVYDAYGSFYDTQENIAACARDPERYGESELYLQDDDGACIPVAVDIGANSISLPRGADNPSSLKLTFNRTTGVVSGSFKFVPEGAAKAVTATYKGVLLPGWGACSVCGHFFRPLMTGSYWYSDKIPYEAIVRGRATQSQLKIARGGAMQIGELGVK